MPRKRKQTISPGRITAIVVLILLLLAGAWAWQHRSRLRSAASTISTELPLPAQSGGSSPSAAANAAAVPVKTSGKLIIRHAAHDTQLGIAADAVALLRSVEMYQWTEHCDGANCRYEKAWSGPHIDSGKFRVAEGHQNPAPPFADARFGAGEIRLGELIVDPRLLDGRPAVDYPVKADALPPNMEATFSVVDGVLYAGGDAAHPQVGTVRVRYRVVPAGEVEISGVRRGNKLEAK